MQTHAGIDDLFECLCVTCCYSLSFGHFDFDHFTLSGCARMMDTLSIPSEETTLSSSCTWQSGCILEAFGGG